MIIFLGFDPQKLASHTWPDGKGCAIAFGQRNLLPFSYDFWLGKTQHA